MWRWRDQIRLWWARASTFTPSASSVSPATFRCRWRSVRTRSARTRASPGSDLAPDTRWRSQVAVDRQRVHGVHPVASGDEGADQQTSVDLDAHGHLRGVRRVGGHHLVQPGHSSDPVRHPALGEHPTLGVHHTHVVVALLRWAPASASGRLAR